MLEKERERERERERGSGIQVMLTGKYIAFYPKCPPPGNPS
jgi:hypothetical protein